MPRSVPHLTARAIWPLVSGLQALGHSPQSTLAAVGIEPGSLEDPDTLVPMRTAVAFLDRAAAATGDSNLGFHLALHAALDSFDVHLYAMLSCANLEEAYRRLCSYQRLIHETSLVELEIEGRTATLKHRMPGGVAVPRHSAEFIVTAWVRSGRLATGTDWAPVEVRFAHPPPVSATEHARYFRAPVQFGTGENALIVSIDVIRLPCVRADAALLSILDRYTFEKIQRTPETASFADSVRGAVARHLRAGEVRVKPVAAELKMSVRTLNRMLAAERTTYREVLEQLRRSLAVRHLADGRIAISEVAFILGFSELSAFHRAFKRWTGLTPAEYRRSHVGPPRLSDPRA